MEGGFLDMAKKIPIPFFCNVELTGKMFIYINFYSSAILLWYDHHRKIRSEVRREGTACEDKECSVVYC